jgi:hypothetical protein
MKSDQEATYSLEIHALETRDNLIILRAFPSQDPPRPGQL